MCNSRLVHVKSLSEKGITQAFVPCGECEECRAVQRNSWGFRLRKAFEALSLTDNPSVCFITLTYRNRCIPTVPRLLFKEAKNYRRIACFNKHDVRGLVKSVRDWLNDTYGIKKPSYLVSSEFGEHTKRPHYHGVWVLPSCVDTDELHAFIRNYWTKRFGFVCPRNPDGSLSIKPFKVTNPLATIKYVAKYCCKDIAFFENCDKFLFVRKISVDGKELRLMDYMPFHFQTRSLGFSYVDSLNESDKLKVFLDGCNCVGDTKLQTLPLYYQNKLLFDNYYVVEKGKRLVRRKPSQFFKDNFREIFGFKVRSVLSRIENWSRGDYWLSLGADVRFQRYMDGLRHELMTYTDNELAVFYVVYFGRKYELCCRNDYAVEWFERFKLLDVDYTVEPLDLIGYRLWLAFTEFFYASLWLESKLLSSDKMDIQREERELKRIHDLIIGG